MPCLQALFFVRGKMRALARFIAVSRLAAPAANPEPRLRKIILLSAATTDRVSDSQCSDACGRISCGDSLEVKIIVRLELEPACRVPEPQT